MSVLTSGTPRVTSRRELTHHCHKAPSAAGVHAIVTHSCRSIDDSVELRSSADSANGLHSEFAPCTTSNSTIRWASVSEDMSWCRTDFCVGKIEINIVGHYLAPNSFVETTNDPVHRAAANDFPFQSRAARGFVCNGLFAFFTFIVLCVSGRAACAKASRSCIRLIRIGVETPWQVILL